MILEATQTPDRLQAAATRQAVDQAVIRKFAPRVYLHREERFLPTSVEHFVQNSRLFSGNGELIAESITLGDLAKHPEEGNYLQLKDSAARLGMPLQNGKCVAPIYVKANCEDAGYDELIYMFFFGYSGYQMFRGSIWRGKTWSYVKRNFEWRDFGGHEGDWEHITVRISKDHQRTLGVYYARHKYGEGNWSAPGSPDYNYPNVYLALNSHASYGQEAITTTDSIEKVAVPILTLGSVRWLKTVDVTANESPVMYASTNRTAPVPWEPSAYVLVNDNTPSWLTYKGHWGGPPKHKTPILKPPSLYGAQDALLDAANIANNVGALPQDIIEVKTPNTPSAQRWWKGEQSMPIIHSETNGGPHGTEFDDTDVLIADQDARVQTISIRTGKRLDQIAIGYTNGALRVHGGSGGAPQSLTLQPDEVVKEIVTYADKKDGHTRIFAIEITTSAGRKLEGGAKSGRSVKVTFDAQHLFAGCFGRSGDEVDLLGFLQIEPVEPEPLPIIETGAKIIVFSDANFQGQSRVLTSPVQTLNPTRFNNLTSSLIVVSGAWELYENVNFEGDAWVVSEDGGPNEDGVYPNWQSWQGDNDVISSLKPQEPPTDLPEEPQHCPMASAEIGAAQQMISDLHLFRANLWPVGLRGDTLQPDRFLKFFTDRELPFEFHMHSQGVSVGEQSAYDANVQTLQVYIDSIRQAETAACTATIADFNHYRELNWAIGLNGDTLQPDQFISFFGERQLPFAYYVRSRGVALGEPSAYRVNIETLERYVQSL